MRRILPEALIAAALTALLLTPIFGLRIQVDGVNVTLNRNPTPVIIAVVIVFLWRLLQEPLRQAWTKFNISTTWRENDAKANLRMWWTDEDRAKFQRLGERTLRPPPCARCASNPALSGSSGHCCSLPP